MGGLFGGMLANAGQDVRFIETSKLITDAVRAHGLKLTRDEEQITVRPQIGAAADFSDPADLIMVFTKSQHTFLAAQACRHLVSNDTWIVTVQNGLGNPEAIREGVGTDCVIAGMTNYPADVEVPSEISSHGHGTTRLWKAFDGDTAAAQRVADLLQQSAMNCVADPDVEVAIWEKVSFNAALNALCALTRLSVGGLGQNEAGRNLAFRVADEAIAVAHAYGIKVDAQHVHKTIRYAFAHHVTHKPSMLQDLLSGRQMEVEAINGAISKRGSDAGVPTPLNSTLADLLRVMNDTKSALAP